MQNANISVRTKKVSNREMRRRAQSAISDGTYAVMILLAALNQHEGEITVDKATIDRTGRDLKHLDFEIVPKGDEQFRLVLTDDRKPKKEVSIVRVPDETAEAQL
jgi:hypothetical protein